MEGQVKKYGSWLICDDITMCKAGQLLDLLPEKGCRRQ